MSYRILAQARRVEKDFHAALDRLTREQRNLLQATLTKTPKGSSSTHWKIKKVKKNLWQCDLPDGYRIAYLVVDTPDAIVMIVFAGNHDDAAAFLRKGL